MAEIEPRSEIAFLPRPISKSPHTRRHGQYGAQTVQGEKGRRVASRYRHETRRGGEGRGSEQRSHVREIAASRATYISTSERQRAARVRTFEITAAVAREKKKTTTRSGHKSREEKDEGRSLSRGEREGGREEKSRREKKGSSPLLPYERVFTPVRDKKRETNAPPPPEFAAYSTPQNTAV